MSLGAAFRTAFPPASKFSTEDIPDLTGKVVIVTGGNAGVGKETASALLSKNAKVYIAGRSSQRLTDAIKQLKETTGREAIPLVVDLADLPSIKRGIEDFLSKETQLHILFNNAGVMNPPVEQVTAQGYDLQFGTNVLGHFYLTKLLLPILQSTAHATGLKGRVVHTSSLAANNAKRLDFETFKDGPARTKKSNVDKLYPQSKLGNVVFANELARRYGEKGIISSSCEPGLLKTDLQRHSALVECVAEMVFYPAAMGALTQLWAGTTDEGLKMNGKYLVPWARYGTANPVAEDPKVGEELWNWLEEQVKGL